MKTEEIQETSEYHKFTFFKFNRPINTGLVRRLKKSIEEIGFIKGKPILVDKTFAIHDGQHRFTALAELKMPIPYYVIKAENAHEVVIALNAEQVNWKTEDYVRSWSEEGVSCYRKLYEFQQFYQINMSQAITIFFKGGDDAGDMKGVRTGKHYSINPEYQRIIEFMIYCKDYIPYWKGSNFVRSLVKIFKRATPAQIEKLKKGIVSLPQQASTENYIVAFENLVNKGVNIKNRITFR